MISNFRVRGVAHGAKGWQATSSAICRPRRSSSAGSPRRAASAFSSRGGAKQFVQADAASRRGLPRALGQLAET